MDFQEEDFNINERFQVTDVSAVVKKKLPISIATEKQVKKNLKT